jgi:hypothetical protein
MLLDKLIANLFGACRMVLTPKVSIFISASQRAKLLMQETSWTAESEWRTASTSGHCSRPSEETRYIGS